MDDNNIDEIYRLNWSFESFLSLVTLVTGADLGGRLYSKTTLGGRKIDIQSLVQIGPVVLEK